MWDLPGAGIEPISPVLAGKFKKNIFIYLFLAALGFVALLAFLWLWRAGATLCYRVQQANSHALHHQGSPNGSFLSPWALNFVGPLEFYP